MAEYPKHWMGRIRTDCCCRYSFFAFLLMINLLSLIALIIGFVFRGQCAIDEKISVYLIVAGFIFTIYYAVLLVVMFVMMRSDAADVVAVAKRKRRVLAISISVICLFMTVWLIVGCVWVFGAKMNVQSFDKMKSTYCPSTLYDFAFFYCIFLLLICVAHYISFCCLMRST